jgi:hypothetical protein
MPIARREVCQLLHLPCYVIKVDSSLVPITAKLLLENDASQYNYIKRSNRYIEGVDDAQEFKNLKVSSCVFEYHYAYPTAMLTKLHHSP